MAPATAQDYARLIGDLLVAQARWIGMYHPNGWGRVPTAARGGVMSGYKRRQWRARKRLAAAIERGAGLPAGAIDAAFGEHHEEAS
jgi:hypothetical protein